MSVHTGELPDFSFNYSLEGLTKKNQYGSGGGPAKKNYGSGGGISNLPFGSLMPGRQYAGTEYRYGFNGMEVDDEVNGGGAFVDFGARGYDSRLGRWLAVDPYAKAFSSLSPFTSVFNSPVRYMDVGGKFPLSSTFRSNFPKVAAMLDEYCKDLAENSGVIESFYDFFNGKLNRDQIRKTILAKSPEDLGSSFFKGGLEIEVAATTAKDYEKLFGATLSWFDDPKIIGNAEGATKRPTEMGEEFYTILINGSFMQDLEAQLASSPEYSDIYHASRKLTFVKRILHEYTHYFSEIVGYKRVDDNGTSWDNGAEWELRFSPFKFTNRYCGGQSTPDMAICKGYYGGVFYLDGKFLLSPELQGVTYSSSDIPDMVKGAKGDLSNWSFKKGNSNKKKYAPRDR